MDEVFVGHVKALRPKLERLLAMTPLTPESLPRHMPSAGVYVLSEGDRHLYVGRSNGIRRRIGRHCRPGATHRMAAFAFRLAREETGNLVASYKKGEGSRAGLMQNRAFADAFTTAKARIRAMDLRFVEESDPVRQTLLEVYVAVVLGTPYNDFDTH
jgi:predicted GIY-YIG superfamily endonuclease